MTELLKARLAEITAGNSPTEVPDTSVDVQFNPTTLRVQIANKTAGGAQAGAQARQRPGTGEMSVAFDLIFDTADEGGDVLELTATVERFVRPKGSSPGQEAPPRVMFEWGSFLVQGTMESANIDLDLFDAGGIPLRAKVAVSIKGQDPRWTYQPAPTASRANPASNPQSGGNTLPSGAPGTSGSSRAPERVVQAMPGESLAQLAARSGLDPSAWRALASGLGNPLQLSLGQEVALPPGLGLGTASGQQAQGRDPARSTAKLPLVDSASSTPVSRSGNQGSSPRAGMGQAIVQGQAVASQGGLRPAIAQAQGQAHQSQARQSANAFGVNGSQGADTQDRPWGAGVPLRPRVGSGQSGPASTQGSQANGSMALRSPAISTTASATTSGSSRLGGSTTPKRASTANTGRSAKGCGCRGRRSRPGR